jgi:hypothetical protein
MSVGLSTATTVMAVLAVPSQSSPTLRLRQLHQAGVSCLVCFDPRVLVPLVHRHEPDLAIVHQRLAAEQPELVDRLHRETSSPILVLAASGPLLGSYDWCDGTLFEDRPLAPQVAAHLPGVFIRRADPLTRWGPLRLDTRSRRAFWHDREIRLTSHQFRAMTLLCEARGGLVSVEALSAHLYGVRVGADRQRVVAHIRRVRRLIEPDPARPQFLLTVRGEGFRLADPAA